MPRLDGRELILELKARGFVGSIIALTAATIGEEMSQLSKAGADIVLAKPLDRDAFSAALTQLLRSVRL